ARLPEGNRRFLPRRRAGAHLRLYLQGPGGREGGAREAAAGAGREGEVALRAGGGPSRRGDPAEQLDLRRLLRARPGPLRAQGLPRRDQGLQALPRARSDPRQEGAGPHRRGSEAPRYAEDVGKSAPSAKVTPNPITVNQGQAITSRATPNFTATTTATLMSMAAAFPRSEPRDVVMRPRTNTPSSAP